MQYDEHIWAWRQHRFHLRGLLIGCWQVGIFKGGRRWTFCDT
jgi:hypothetical protein